MSYKVRNTDANHTQIAATFKRMGYSVKDMSGVGGGFPDLIVAKHGDNDLVEIKTEEGELEESQRDFALRWNAPVYLIRSVDNIVDFDAGNKIQFQII